MDSIPRHNDPFSGSHPISPTKPDTAVNQARPAAGSRLENRRILRPLGLSRLGGQDADSNRRAESGAGVLTSAVGVEDHAGCGPASLDGHAQRADDQGCRDIRPERPADYSPGIEVQDPRQVVETVGRSEVGDVAHPPFVGPGGGEILLDQVREDRSIRVTSVFAGLKRRC